VKGVLKTQTRSRFLRGREETLELNAVRTFGDALMKKVRCATIRAEGVGREIVG